MFSLGFVLGEDPTGVDLVDPHPVLLHEGIPKVAGEGHEGPFGGGIGKEGRFPAMGVHAADVDYASRRLA